MCNVYRPHNSANKLLGEREAVGRNSSLTQCVTISCCYGFASQKSELVKVVTTLKGPKSLFCGT